MSDPQSKNPGASSEQVPSPRPSRMVAVFDFLQLLISLVLVSCVLAWLLWVPGEGAKAAQTTSTTTAPRPAVEVEDFKRISVELESPLGHRLSLQTVKASTVTEPLLHVTGRVVASRRPGPEGGKDFWQFNSGELVNTYADWEKATVDIQFTESQLQQITALATAKESAQQKAIERLEKLVRDGTETEKEVTAQKAELLQTQIQDRKDIYQAEVAIKTSRREATRLSLQLHQSGFDPEKLHQATADMDIVTAEVPEAMLDRVVIGQSCTAQFYGIPDETFEGQVTTLSPVLSTDQRTLRVLFTVHDPRDRLRPGMFASIGLGTDPRSVLRIPAASVIHVARTDYVLVADSMPTSADAAEKEATVPPVDPTAPVAVQSSEASHRRVELRVVDVVVAELIDGQVEVKSGLKAGDNIVGDHGILLKPLVVTSLRTKATTDQSSPPAAPEILPQAEKKAGNR